MNYYFYNTDVSSRYPSNNNLTRLNVLFEKGFAISGGLFKFGKKFAKLDPNDILLMYENKIGVVGVGRVIELWDGVQYEELLFYTPDDFKEYPKSVYEYRISVDWYIDMRKEPLTITDIRKCFNSGNFSPRGTISNIKKFKKEAKNLIERLEKS
jgi:hypothetical protein